jgi:23S rRNA (cytidine1920-2'-O)/16S rRNA (cytidine1409-2'-O)-methyltransferase
LSAKPKERLDEALVRRGLAPSRERARALVLAGKVLVDDAPVDKAGARVAVDARVTLREPDHPFVSRGGVKLAGALDAFALSPAGRVCADVGASTGGFTQVLLDRGARRVFAVDVGYGQLAEPLRRDARVVVLERTNARHLPEGSFDEPPAFVVVDVSFISVTKVLPAVLAQCAREVDVVVLVKPQFEAGREHVDKGGVVRDDAARTAAVDAVAAFGRTLGLAEKGRADSVLAGPRGNREVFLWLAGTRAQR